MLSNDDSETNWSQLGKALSYCTCQSKDHLVNILKIKGTKNKLDYIRILGFGLKLACN